MSKLKIGTAVFAAFLLASCGSSPAPQGDALDRAIRSASDYLNSNLERGSVAVILNIGADSEGLSNYVIDELLANAVNDRVFQVVDRQQLDLIRAEQNFQMSGDVDDSLAVSIGQFFGAQTIVSGRIDPFGEQHRLTLRALDVQTARVRGQYNHNIGQSQTVTTLLRTPGAAGAQVTQGTGTQGTGTAASQTAGTTQTAQTPPAPVVTSVTLNPASVTVAQGQTQQFSADVTGNNNPDLSVTWAVTGASSGNTQISEDGLLTVGTDELFTPLTVTAVSTANRSISSQAQVTVPGGISAIMVNNVATWNAAVGRVRNGGNNQTYLINVTGNITVSVPPSGENLFGSVTGITVMIQGNGTLAMPAANGHLLRIGARQEIVLRDVTLRGHQNNNTSLVHVASEGVFRMEGNAQVTGNRNGNSMSGDSNIGAGVNVAGGMFIMTGGTVSNNNGANHATGGVRVGDGGTFIMQGGAVSGNNGDLQVGGVRVSSGTFTMEGGSVQGNTSRSGSGGGGVRVESNARFNMSGGTISGNTSNASGGGVRIEGGTFTKTGGTIYGADATIVNRNTSTGGQRRGHAILFTSFQYQREEQGQWRNVTAGPEDRTDGFGFWLND
jgi:hypothetical protein